MGHSKQNRAVDPLEMAKVGLVKPEPTEPELPSELEASDTATAAPTDGAREEPAEQELPPPEPSKPEPRWRVLEEKTISLRGQMVVMRAGRVLTPEFAHVNMAALLEQGVKLEELPPQ